MAFNSLKWRIIITITGIVAVSLVITTFFIQQRAKDALSDEIESNAYSLLDATRKHVESQHKSILYHKSIMLERRKIELKNNALIAFAMIERLYQEYKSGHVSELLAKQRALSYLNKLRYDDGVGYFWVNDKGRPFPSMVMHPMIPSLDGKILDDPKFNCALGKNENLFKAFVDVVRENGDGYVDYLWPKPTNEGLTEQQPKMSFVKEFKPWSWVIGTGVYIDDIDKDVQGRIDAVIKDLNESLQSQKIGQSGYFFMFDESNQMLIHPNIAGTDMNNMISPMTGNILTEDLKKANLSSSRSMEYLWDRPGYEGEYVFLKKAYITYYGPLGWYICSSIYKKDLEQKVSELTNTIFIFFSFFSAFSIFIALLISKSIANPLNTLINAISKTGKDGIPVESIPVAGTNEIKLLSNTIRNMIFSISQSREVIKESEAKFRGLVESSSDIIWEANINGVFKYISPQAENILGYKPEDMVEKPLFEFMSKKESERVKPIFTQAVLDRVQFDRVEHMLLHKGGSSIYVEANGVPAFDEVGEIISYRGVMRDISKRKKDEQELKLKSEELLAANAQLTTHKEHLLELVDERTLKLNESLDNLRRTQDYLVETEKMAALGGLVAGVAHEINTPIGSCLTAASYLEDKTKDIIKYRNQGALKSSEFNSYINLAVESTRIILSNIERAAALIQSFKQVAVDQSCEELREFEIKQYIDEILISIHSKFKNTPYKIVVNCPQEFTINSYPGAISQVITNFLINSLVHGFAGYDEGAINIDIRKVGETVCIIYQDSGCGISEKNLPHIYEPFFTTKRGQGGSGLGLQIVYNLVVQTLVGKIECTSTVGKGTRFELEFPCDLLNTDQLPS